MKKSLQEKLSFLPPVLFVAGTLSICSYGACSVYKDRKDQLERLLDSDLNEIDTQKWNEKKIKENYGNYISELDGIKEECDDLVQQEKALTSRGEVNAGMTYDLRKKIHVFKAILENLDMEEIETVCIQNAVRQRMIESDVPLDDENIKDWTTDCKDSIKELKNSIKETVKSLEKLDEIIKKRSKIDYKPFPLITLIDPEDKIVYEANVEKSTVKNINTVLENLDDVTNNTGATFTQDALVELDFLADDGVDGDFGLGSKNAVSTLCTSLNVIMALGEKETMNERQYNALIEGDDSFNLEELLAKAGHLHFEDVDGEYEKETAYAIFRFEDALVEAGITKSSVEACHNKYK
ncbi:hypothetical protein GF340_05080 [Candidatus Peregrinibacteria bacterium]|nr:hypothetical protein [Candidatus Peregrinibacteria bacterium]